MPVKTTRQTLQPLIEVFASDFGRITLEEKDSGPNGRKQLWLETPVQKADVRNRNGRVYPRAVLEREVERFQEHIKAGTSYGAADHPKPGEVPSVLSQAVLWKGVTMDEAGLVRARGIVMETHAGQQVRAILDAGGAIGTSSRGRGTVSLKSHGKTSEQSEVVNDDYQLRTFDLVIDQSVPDAVSRLAKYEQHLMEQEGVQEPENMKLTLETLKAEHPEAYRDLLAEAKKDMGSDEALQSRLAALLKERETELREKFRAEMTESGCVLDEARATRVAGLEAFATVVIEAAKEAGILANEALGDEEAATKIKTLQTECADLKRKLAMLEAANADLAGKGQKVEVDRAARKLAEGHVLADDLIEALTEACSTMDEFTAKKDAIKARFDKLASRMTAAPAAGTGKTHVNEQTNPPPGSGNAKTPPTAPANGKQNLSEGQKRLAMAAGLNG